MSFRYRKFLCLIVMLLALVLTGGCASIDRFLPADAPILTSAQEAQLGEAVSDRLLQLLGGPYFDKKLAADLNRLARRFAPQGSTPRIAIADKAARAFYRLPSKRVVVTRGLLAELRNPQELEQLLNVVASPVGDVLIEGVSRHMVAAIDEMFNSDGSVYDVDAPAIRLARVFMQRPCDDSCLQLTSSLSGASTEVVRLPESLLQLTSLNEGYALLVEAREKEKAGDRSAAIATYLQAAAKTPDTPRILGNLGFAYLRTGDLHSAGLHLKSSVKHQSDYYRTRMGLGYFYLQTGKVRKANAELASSIKLLPVDENLFLLAEAREKGGDLDGAESLYRLVVDNDRNSKLGKSARTRLKAMEKTK